MMKEYVNSQKFRSTTGAMTGMKEMFKDVLDNPDGSFTVNVGVHINATDGWT